MSVWGGTRAEQKWEGRWVTQSLTMIGDYLNPITITGPGIKGSRQQMLALRITTTRESATITGLDGTVTVFRQTEAPPRWFELTDFLRTGGYEPDALPIYRYRLEDVRVGDEVELQLQQSDICINVCKGICIKRRPGGQIPPLPDEDLDAVYTWHGRSQSYQDWEEKGIPIPDKYHLGGPQTGIAPMPREAIPRIPSARE